MLARPGYLMATLCALGPQGASKIDAKLAFLFAISDGADGTDGIHDR